MDAHQNLFYGLGIIAYAVARADGKIQQDEKQLLHDIVHDWEQQLDENFDVTEIIFSILEKNKPAFAEGYKEGLHHIRLGEQYLNEKLKEKFLLLIVMVAKAFPPVTLDEQEILNQFENDLASM